MINGYIIAHDGIYDTIGKKYSVEEIMSEHIQNGGFVSKTAEDRTIYRIDDSGYIVRERRFCEVFVFE